MIKIPENPFILVDGSSYLFRAYHALPPLTTKKGQPTGAIFGVVNMLRKLIKDYRPNHMAVVFDSKEKNFRHQKFPAYKANRLVMPDELQSQIQPLFEIIKAQGLPLIVMPGFEADDIIGTLAKEAKKRGIFTLISTGDKDFAQIVDEQTFLINTMSQDIFDRARVIEKFELPPERIVEYLALIGDSVDNIPGIPKVGPKTALKWLQTYQTLDNIVKHANDIPGKVGENLRAHLDQLPLFSELLTIQVDLPLEIHFDNLVKRPVDTEKLSVLFTELEFRTWLKELNLSIPSSRKDDSEQDAGQETEMQMKEAGEENFEENLTHTQLSTQEKQIEILAKAEYETLTTKDQFLKFLEKLKKTEIFAFACQTNNENYMVAELLGISFSLKPFEAVYIPFGHIYENAPSQLSRDWVVTQLKPILENPLIKKIGHNLKLEAEILANQGIFLQGIFFDVLLASYVLDSTGKKHDLQSLVQGFLEYDLQNFEDLVGKGSAQLNFNEVFLEKAAFYAAERSDFSFRLQEKIGPTLSKTPTLKEVLEKIELPLIPVLVEMERTGVLIDPQLLKTQGQALALRIKQLEEEIYTLGKRSFNINSPKQLQEILFNELKLPIIEKTPTGQASTSEAVLQTLAEDYPLPKLILEYRSLSKLKSTYIDTLPLQIHPVTGRIHTSYHQAVTATGRLSSSSPNLQNIPIRSLEGRKIRTAFIAPPGSKILTADYSQSELRIMAHMSQDSNLLKAFSQDDDIHKSTAASIFGVPLEEVTFDQRRSAKVINFGLMYGMSAFGVAKQLKISPKEADQHIERYFSCFPGVKIFMESLKKQALEQGFVETIFGRRLYLPDLQARKMSVKKAAERAAINAPMQGSNADIIKLAMIEIHDWIEKGKFPIKMIMQVHDELVFEVSDDFIETASQKIKMIMENVFPLSVKLHVSLGTGNNWEEAHS